MPPTAAGKAITRCREERHFSKRRLAREAHLSPAYIVQLENGERPPTPNAMLHIADALGVPPYALLTEAGFISREHTEEAERIAKLAWNSVANPETDHGIVTFDWYVADYLDMLGDDPYATGHDYPHRVLHDWSELAPERWKALQNGEVNAITFDQLNERISEMRAEERLRAEALRARQATPIEGWDDLTDTQRRLVQQLVNQFRRSANGD
jgi:transcriptional regulator with XRE-family HTH domain